MKALILNSGLGSRMGVLTSEHPKCMTEIAPGETILSRQLKLIANSGIREVVMTTGYFDEVLVDYCNSLELPIHYTFVKNPIYDQTNYIYSIYCARKYLDDDIVLMHGDLVFENEVFDRLLASSVSCMTVSSTLPLPEKDFKAQIRDGKIMKVGTPAEIWSSKAINEVCSGLKFSSSSGFSLFPNIQLKIDIGYSFVFIFLYGTTILSITPKATIHWA